MDFIARAGAIVDRGHRVIGLLLVVAVLQLYWIFSIYEEKASLQNTIDIQNANQSVYVVPNSQAGIYKPAEGQLLLSTFVDYITQNLMTYTPANMERQYKSIRGFFDNKIRVIADKAFKIEKHKSRVEEISSIYIVNTTSTNLDAVRQFTKDDNGKKIYLDEVKHVGTTKYGNKTYEVTLSGVRSFVVAGRTLSSKPVQHIINVQETRATEKNPFGYVVTLIKEVKVDK